MSDGMSEWITQEQFNFDATVFIDVCVTTEQSLPILSLRVLDASSQIDRHS